MAVTKVQASAQAGGLAVDNVVVVAKQQETIANLTAASGTASDTITDVGGSFNQGTLNNAFKSVAEKINKVLAALKAHGLIASE